MNGNRKTPIVKAARAIAARERGAGGRLLGGIPPKLVCGQPGSTLEKPTLFEQRVDALLASLIGRRPIHVGLGKLLFQRGDVGLGDVDAVEFDPLEVG